MINPQNTTDDELREKIEKFSGSGAHACYCDRSTDGGCTCALKDEYVDEIMKDVDSLIQKAREEAEIDALAVARNYVDFAIRWKQSLKDVLAVMDKRLFELKKAKGEKK